MQPIVDHPYRDNNGPTYMYGVCREHNCGQSVFKHTTMEVKRNGRITVVATPEDDKYHLT